MVNKVNQYKATVSIVIFVIILNIIGSLYYLRFDLTQDKRYTISETSKTIINSVQSPLVIDLFLDGELPAEIGKLRQETKQLLDEFKSINPNINYRFSNPIDTNSNNKDVLIALAQEGITPITITKKEKGKQTQEIILPWAIVSYNDISTKVPLLKSKLGASTNENIINSVQNLEYEFTDAFQKVTTPKKKKIAILKGNGQSNDIYIADVLKTIREKYYLAPFTLDSVAQSPNKTLKELQQYDLMLVAQPTESFTDEEKLVLDQFVINGGNSMWLIDPVAMDMDSLYTNKGTAIASIRDLNLNDLFFKYGIRINSQLVKDVMCAPISLATGQRGNNTQYAQYPWLYAPLCYPNSNHPIISNIESVKLSFASPIDTLANPIKKTILLQSSSYTKRVGMPTQVSLSMVNERPKQEEFNSNILPFGVLLEGEFTSNFKNRILPFKYPEYLPQGKPSKMIVYSDGDIIKNQLDQQGAPLELGFDKWTNMTFGNKDLIINSINYLLDENGLIDIRSKKVILPILDQEKVYQNYSYIQFISIGAPLLILLAFGLLFYTYRKRKYSH